MQVKKPPYYLCSNESFTIFFFTGTYFSENALLPGLVHSNYKEDSLARKYLAALKVKGVKIQIFVLISLVFLRLRQRDIPMACHIHS